LCNTRENTHTHTTYKHTHTNTKTIPCFSGWQRPSVFGAMRCSNFVTCWTQTTAAPPSRNQQLPAAVLYQGVPYWRCQWTRTESCDLMGLALHRAQDQFRVTLGPNVMYSNLFSCMHERNVLQAHLVTGLSRHGLAPTPWHPSKTGPCNNPPQANNTYPDTLPRPQDYPDPIPPRLAPSSRTQILFPILHNPPLARTEAQHRGLDTLQILHALLDLGNPTESVPDHLSLSIGEIWALQHHHRALIHHLRVLLPILFLTHQQRPYRAKLGRVGRTLLVELLSHRRHRAATRQDPTHT